MGQPDTVIRVENLSKRYVIGRSADRGPATLRDTVAGGVRALGRRLFGRGRSAAADRSEEFWALRDVSFEVRRGEVVGIIGRNGAGKSTLLKVLSRITEPTAGRVEIDGRVASLLEVGTGFHGELTGRENVYLNGAILGMTRAEIRRKFDEIVAFAEVEKFLDTPVKRYSSGMYMRLAFAVAAHLEPEILIVDEVLAVGDATFQKKCLGKMGEVSKHGRTVLFVSHNMAAVRSLCGDCCVLGDGRLLYQGNVATSISRYMQDGADGEVRSSRRFTGSTQASPRMVSATLTAGGAVADNVQLGSPLTLRVEYEAAEPLRAPKLGLIVSGANHEPLFNINNRYLPGDDPPAPTRGGVITCELGVLPLTAGSYLVSLWLGDSSFDTHVEMDALQFDVVDFNLWGADRTPSSPVAPLWWPARFNIEAGLPDSSGS